MNKTIELGDQVKDTVTGFSGTVIGITTWLNGCRRMGIQGKEFKDGIPTDPIWVDEYQLKVTKKAVVQTVSRETGGPTPTPMRSKNPTV